MIQQDLPKKIEVVQLEEKIRLMQNLLITNCNEYYKPTHPECLKAQMLRNYNRQIQAFELEKF